LFSFRIGRIFEIDFKIVFQLTYRLTNVYLQTNDALKREARAIKPDAGF
jgi:hypothetical protein